MLLRASARNDPRVGKEAATLAEAGCRVVIVSVKLPGEDRSVERIGRHVVVVRTGTGLLQRLRHWLRRSSPTAGAGAQGLDQVELSKKNLILLLMSRVLLAVKFAGLCVRSRPDAIVAHDFNTLPAGSIAAMARGVPLLYDAHEVNVSREGYYRQLRPIILTVEGCLIRRCDRVSTTTATRARHFQRVYHLSRAPAVLQNRPEAVAGHAVAGLRATLGIQEDALLCIYQGGLQEGRGLHNLVEAVASLECVHLAVLGGGRQGRSLEALAGQRGVGSRIHFLGSVAFAEVAPITRAADVGIQVLRNTCFNHWSTDSNKLFEYAQAGLPVVASDFPEIRKIVRRYDFGLLVDPHSVDSIAGALKKLREQPELLAKLRRNAEVASSELNWDTEKPKLLEIFEELGVLRRT